MKYKSRNQDVRVAIYESHFTKESIAHEIGITKETFSRWLSKQELDSMRKTLIHNAIQRLKEKR